MWFQGFQEWHEIVWDWSNDSRCHDHGAFKVQAVRVAETNLSGLSQIFGVCGCLLFGLFDCGTRNRRIVRTR
jgi:hypothetical protein